MSVKPSESMENLRGDDNPQASLSEQVLNMRIKGFEPNNLFPLHFALIERVLRKISGENWAV